MTRSDDFQERRKHLADMSEKDLDKKFWELAEKVVDPLIDLAEKHTSPSIERSVLLRMGFSSTESKMIVDGILDKGLIGKGAGNIVYKLANTENIEVRDAGLELVNGNMWDKVDNLFSGGDN
ncbi:MAG TPA: ornithine aminomutase subunit alpha [Tissierellaceae bacterium]|nr:ornithine aminomutase subunit alpha [Tissierellaceae bacterium]